MAIHMKEAVVIITAKSTDVIKIMLISTHRALAALAEVDEARAATSPESAE